MSDERPILVVAAEASEPASHIGGTRDQAAQEMTVILFVVAITTLEQIPIHHC
jgi:hypothetical protein